MNMFPGDLMPRQVGAGNSHFPCPSGNGTQIGDVEKFNVLCGLDIGGVEIDRMQVDSLGTCVSICTSYQGTRCDGVTFRLDNVCIFKTAFTGGQFQKTTNADSAIGILPNPPTSSRCDSLGTGAIQLVTSKNFNLQCGQVFAGNDIEQQFQPTFDACLNACAAMTACGGVSYDVQQSQGFKNCFLKTTVTTGGLLSKAGIDSAFMTVDNSAPMVVSQPSSSVLQATPSIAQLSPANTADTASLGDTSSQSTRILTSSSTIVPLSETTSSSIPSLELATSTAASSMATTSSNAWIAAPVIGSIAAVALLIGLYVLWIRRRRQNHGLPISFIDRFRGGGIHRAPSFTGGAKFDDEAAVRSLSVSSSNSHNDILVTRVVSRDMDSPSRSRPGTGDGQARFLAPLELLPLEDVVVDKTNSVLRNSQNGLKLNGVSVRSTDKEPLPVTSTKERDDTKPSDSGTSDRTSQ